MSLAKPSDKLTPSDWEKYPVWTFDLDNEGKAGRDETWMVPLKKLPATDLRNGGCHANATLACGQAVTVVLWGVRLRSDPKEDEFLKNFAHLIGSKILRHSIWVKDRWWITEREGRYLSLVDFKKHEPTELAGAVGLTIDEVFPITYDISAFAIGPDSIIRGKIFLATR